MKVLFAAHDAGGANAIAPVVLALKERGIEVIGIASGPAADIFAKRGITTGAEKEFAGEAEVYLFGTSAGETIEKQVFLSVKDRMPSIAVLDYWSNYAERFSRQDRDLTYMPDRICVMDDIARAEMLAQEFLPERIVVTGNPHFDHFADEITHDRENRKRLLFVSQPLSDMARLPGYVAYPFDEFTVLSDIVAALGGTPVDYQLAIRLHPKEQGEKYKKMLNERVVLAQESTLEQALSGAGLIIGMHSLVLLQAAAAGKSVISYEPGLVGPDPLVSNRLGVTRRLSSPVELADAFALYAAQKLSKGERLMRDVWPAGATERVVEAVLSLGSKK
ncbi:hypothetical protein A2635_05550 [Candidatus Peribacteria bacterium RIFCSPHIGHO2_01_FULL_51_9]|nr:MAG: hypothetical protein A2635_05550 [Candidatus Peribacteria bacterium RIFCSPHIGHO2_01_FULL_51_9]